MAWLGKDREGPTVDLVHPVYLNTSMMLDFLAHFDDGVSFSSDVSRKVDTGRKKSGGGTASAGLPSVASLLGLNLSASGRLDRERTENESIESKVVRNHTGASLFNRLRSKLEEAQAITRVTSVDEMNVVSHGSTIELEGVIDRNPLEAIAQLYEDVRPYFATQKRMDIRKEWDDEDYEDEEAGGTRQEQVRAAADREMVDMDEMFAAISEDLKKGNVIDLPMTTTAGLSALLIANREFYTSEAEAALLGGRFKVLGKVSALEPRLGERLTIVRRGVVGLIGEQRLQLLLDGMKNDDIDLSLPPIVIESPWLQVIPLAVYV